MISLGLHERGGSLELAVKIGRTLPDDKHTCASSCSPHWTNCFFTAATSCCQMYTSLGLTVVSPAFAFGYLGTCRVGRLSALIAFAMLAPPLYSILYLYVFGYGIDLLLVFGRVFCVSSRRCGFRVLTPL